MDFYFGSQIIDFDAGMTMVQFNISINDDNIFEGNETFDLSINSSTLPNKVIVGNPGQTTVTIVDNDGKYVKSHVYLSFHIILQLLYFL